MYTRLFMVHTLIRHPGISLMIPSENQKRLRGKWSSLKASGTRREVRCGQSWLCWMRCEQGRGSAPCGQWLEEGSIKKGYFPAAGDSGTVVLPETSIVLWPHWLGHSHPFRRPPTSLAAPILFYSFFCAA